MLKSLKFMILCAIALVATAANSTEIKFDQNLAVAHCEDQWTKRGILDGDMFSYCMEQQIEGYDDTLYLYNKYSNIERVELIDEVVRFALGKWVTRKEYQMDMVAYEIEVQGEAYLNIAYELRSGNIGAGLLEYCKSNWLSKREPQWDMVEYCLDR